MTNTIRISAREIRVRSISRLGYFLHINCNCRIASTLVGTYATSAEAKAAHIADAAELNTRTPKLTECTKNQPEIAPVAEVEPAVETPEVETAAPVTAPTVTTVETAPIVRAAKIEADMQSPESGIGYLPTGHQILIGKTDGRFYAEYPYGETDENFHLTGFATVRGALIGAARRFGTTGPLTTSVCHEYH